MVRLKNRYLLVNILYPEATGTHKIPDVVAINQPTSDALTPQLLLKAIRAEVLRMFGDYGSGAVAESLSLKYLSPATSTFILRVSRANYRIAWAALSCMDEVPVRDGQRCIYRVVRVSGTIKKAEEEAIRTAREMMLRARRQAGDSDAALEKLLGGKQDKVQLAKKEVDVTMVDANDSEDGHSGGDG